jgi:hypothetical protein
VKGCTVVPPSQAGLRVVAIPRVDGSTLSFSTFYRKFALPGLPVILTGLGTDWAARTKWSTLQVRLSAFLNLSVVLPSLALRWSEQGLLARGVDVEEEIQIQVGGQRIATMTVGQVFQTLAERDVATTSRSATGSAGGRAVGLPRKRARSNAAPSINKSMQRLEPTENTTDCFGTQPPGELYLRNWRFHERNPHLLSDYTVPALFSLDFAEEAGLIAPNSFTWLYIVRTVVAFSFKLTASLNVALPFLGRVRPVPALRHM